MIATEQHATDREAFFSQVSNFWHNVSEEPYALYDVQEVSYDFVDRIRVATERMGIVFAKIGDLLRVADDETLLSLGFSEVMLPYIRIHYTKFPIIIGRFDFVYNGKALKMLELNAETPTFIEECFRVNGLVCEAFGFSNPNIHLEAMLARAMKQAIHDASAWVGEENPHVVFTAHDDNEEDYLTTLYLMDLAGENSFVSLQNLRVDESGLYDEAGNRIHVLYKQTYPSEHLVHDFDASTQVAVGELLLKLVQEKKLAVLNPPSAFLLQSKAVQAAIWGIYESGNAGTGIFTADELAWIGEYMLPTYLESDTFGGKKFVSKASFGREGDSVKIFDESGSISREENTDTFEAETLVYQGYIDLPTTTVSTPKGLENVHMLIGSFLVSGQPAAIGLRVGEQITGNRSYFLPMGYKK
jgi:glutathionylspermidine synthase